MLLLLGVPPRTAEEFMGWSNGPMAKRYQHVTATMLQGIAGRLDRLLWGDN